MFAISQVETIDLAKFAERRTNLLKTIQDLCAQKGYGLMCLMVTDIFEEGTELIVAGDMSRLVEDEFQHDHIKGGIFLKGVLSRKKQVVPVIYEMLRKQMIM
jgi:manganese-dependent inorganic pyrophosphatase